MPARYRTAILLLAVIIGVFLVGQHLANRPSDDPLEQRAYVWQRLQNSPEVTQAIESVPDSVNGLLPLVAEIHFKQGPENPPAITRPTLAVSSFQDRAEAGKTDAAVIRIGVSAADTKWDAAACEIVADIARGTLISTIWAPP
ncbi:MAG: hypothetical protein HKN23_21685, partial [Verrucomicrobiales bacterium]|nr:hypothetical protein [Verrucomicrobiales bacterium]